MMFAIGSYTMCLCAIVVLLALLAHCRAKYIESQQLSPRNRGLFRYFDGVKIQTIDPIAVLQAYEAHAEFRFDKHPEKVREGDAEAIRIVLDATRNAFNVPAFTQVGLPGLTQKETIELFESFVSYSSAQKKNTEPNPT